MGRGSAVKVRSAVVRSAETSHNSATVKRGGSHSSETPKSGRPSPICFVCEDSKLRHYLGECKKFQTLTNEDKRRVVIDAGRCINCLSTGYIAKNCPKESKCKLYGPQFRNKHAAALHNAFTLHDSYNFRAAITSDALKFLNPMTQRGMKRLMTMNPRLYVNCLRIAVRLCGCELALLEFLIPISISALWFTLSMTPLLRRRLFLSD